MRELLLTNQAEADLRGIWAYSTETWGERQADRYLDSLASTMLRCGDAPERGKRRNDIRPGVWLALAERHVIFYRFDETQVVLQRVLHGAMDPTLHVDDEQ